MQTKMFDASIEGLEISSAFDHALSVAKKETRVFESEARKERQNRPGGCRELSKREQDVLLWLAQGKSAQETSMILGISLCTVRAHIRSMLKKLEASNIPHAVARAFQKRLLNV